MEGGYFLPMDEEMHNRQLVNDSIQRIIKARGPSYGGEMYDEMAFEEDEGGCMGCPMGSGMNPKAKVYQDYLKKRKITHTLGNWNKFKKTKAYRDKHPKSKEAKAAKAAKAAKKPKAKAAKKFIGPVQPAKKPKAVKKVKGPVPERLKPWLAFLKKYKSQNVYTSYKDMLKQASAEYKEKKKGGYLY